MLKLAIAAFLPAALIACAVSPHLPEDDSEYEFSINEVVAELFPEGEVPFGVLFRFYDQPTGISPVAEEKMATVFVELDGFRVKVAIEPGDTRLSVARRVARAFKHKHVRTIVHPEGDWIACVSPHDEDVQSVSMQSLDTGMGIGFDYFKY